MVKNEKWTGGRAAHVCTKKVLYARTCMNIFKAPSAPARVRAHARTHIKGLLGSIRIFVVKPKNFQVLSKLIQMWFHALNTRTENPSWIYQGPLKNLYRSPWIYLPIPNIFLIFSGLTDPNNYHEFCRLLARLKSNYQLGELVMVDQYPESIQLMAKFTVESLQMWQFGPNSIHYLLSLWQRMVASVPYVKATEPHLLETYTPEVTQAYIRSR